MNASVNLPTGATEDRYGKSLFSVRDILLVILAALVMRGIFLGNPHMDVDEQFYLLTGGRMLDGAVPFVDIWDRKPIGLFLIFAFANLFGNGVLAYEVMALLSVAATGIIICAMARRYADRWSALLAGVGYVVVVNLLDGAGGQSPVYYNLLIAASAFLVQRQLRSRVSVRLGGMIGTGAVIMLLCGIAIQVKYLVIGEGLFFGLVLMWLALRRFGVVPALGAGVLWVTIALLPTIAAIGYYAWIGELDALMFANFHSIFLRPEDPLDWQIDRLLAIAEVLTVPLAIGIAGLALSRGMAMTEDQRSGRRFAIGWAASAWIAFIIFGTYFKHYALPLAGPTMLLFACATGRWQRLRTLIVILGAVWGVRSPLLTSENEVGTATLNRIVSTMGDSRNCPFVFRGPSVVYHLGDFCLPTAYVFPYFLNHQRENPTLGVTPDVELRRVIATRPDYILLRWPMYDYSQSSLDTLLPILCRDYRPVLNEVQRRNEALILYRLRPGVEPLPNDIGGGGSVGTARRAGAVPQRWPADGSDPRPSGPQPKCPWRPGTGAMQAQ